MTDRILVPYDASEPARDALEYAITEYPDADTTVVHVLPAPGGYWDAWEDPDVAVPGEDRATERGETYLADAEELAADHDVEIDTELEKGRPARVLVDAAEEGDYDLVVVGSHGREGVSRVLLGSVAETVVRRSPTPVVVVR
ncbi:universal stress protein [Natrarchaeobaculum aegyptiacum]|uniref:Universal stress protein UspA n=1 Tax=Natrarchaeobaculum aegyptiacum TaxID=745377 RepID=A0A2Z2HUR0_9EURY|nr:universal stress protein [Natrarchaeobaculum aegyptiacum]ARS90999.1 universal stress protein UspA [Natrarchaeobaculum aegyptiacum]